MHRQIEASAQSFRGAPILAAKEGGGQAAESSQIQTGQNEDVTLCGMDWEQFFNRKKGGEYDAKKKKSPYCSLLTGHKKVSTPPGRGGVPKQ